MTDTTHFAGDDCEGGHRQDTPRVKNAAPGYDFLDRGSELETALLFQLKAVGIEQPVRELRFHPTRRWRFDMAWPEKKVAVEVEGGIYVQGGHNRGAHIESDCEKVSEAAALGWRVLRVTRHMIEDGRAVALLEKALS